MNERGRQYYGLQLIDPAIRAPECAGVEQIHLGIHRCVRRRFKDWRLPQSEGAATPKFPQQLRKG
jgi:hypothetical protein